MATKKTKKVEEPQVDATAQQPEQDPKETIQKYILEGRKVLIKKENETSFVRIRFNNNDTDGTTKWRVIINGNLLHTSEIVINCQTRTLTENFEDVGIKHHMVCNANEILFENNIAYIK
jgi:hypothetical protein